MKKETKELREFRLSDVKVFPDGDSKWKWNSPKQKWIDANNLKGRAYMQSCEVTDIYLSDKYVHEGIVVKIHENENRQRYADSRTFHFQVVNERYETKKGDLKYKDVVKIRYVEGSSGKKGDGYFYSQSRIHPNGPEVDRPIDMLSDCLSYSESFSKNVMKAILAFNELAQEAISKLKDEISEHNRKIKQEEKDKEERKRQYEKLRKEFG
jgi:gas vesicle protein